MNRKQPQPMPEGTKRPTPPPCPPKLQSLKKVITEMLAFEEGVVYQSMLDSNTKVLCTANSYGEYFEGARLKEVNPWWYSVADASTSWEGIWFNECKEIIGFKDGV